MIQSLLAEYKESGLHTTPIWPLWGNETWCIGYHSVPVIEDAYLKGFRGFDPEVAYQAMRDTAMQDRNGLKTYKELGPVCAWQRVVPSPDLPLRLRRSALQGTATRAAGDVNALR